MGFFATSGILNRRGFFGGIQASAPFSPTDLTGLSLWLKADAGVSEVDGDITAWADQSGNGNNATATDTPTLTTISGKTFVDFSEGFFTGDEILTQPYATIMVVANFTAARQVEVIFQQFNGDGEDNVALYRGHLGADNIFAIFNGASFGSVATTDDDVTYLFGVTVDSDVGSLYLNASPDEVGDSGASIPAGEYYIGKWAGGDTPTAEMRMAEIVIYNRVLTTPERQQVEAYLNTKYEIY